MSRSIHSIEADDIYQKTLKKKRLERLKEIRLQDIKKNKKINENYKNKKSAIKLHIEKKVTKDLKQEQRDNYQEFISHINKSKSQIGSAHIKATQVNQMQYTKAMIKAQQYEMNQIKIQERYTQAYTKDLENGYQKVYQNCCKDSI